MDNNNLVIMAFRAAIDRIEKGHPKTVDEETVILLANIISNTDNSMMPVLKYKLTVQALLRVLDNELVTVQSMQPDDQIFTPVVRDFAAAILENIKLDLQSILETIGDV